MPNGLAPLLGMRPAQAFVSRNLRSRRSRAAHQTSSIAVALVLVVLAATPVQAFVIAEDELEDSSTELGLIARSFTFSLLGEPLDAPVGLGVLDFRSYIVKRSSRWKLVLHDQFTTTFRSQALLGLGLVGRGLPPPRLLPLQQNIANDATFAMKHVADWLYASWFGETVTLTVGRQPITFGRGSLWKPYDLIGTFALTQVDREYKPGADALRVDWSPNEKTVITAVAAIGELEQDNDIEAKRQGTSIVVRGKRSLDGGEVGFLAGYVRGDALIGTDGVYDAGPFELYAEATVTRPSERSLDSPQVGTGELAIKASAGAVLHPVSTLSLTPELMFNDFGGSSQTDYLSLALSDRAAIGEQIFMGTHYAGLAADWEAHALLHVVGAAIVNMRDPSSLLSLGLSYNLANNVQAMLGGYVPVGQDSSEYGNAPTLLYFELKAVL